MAIIYQHTGVQVGQYIRGHGHNVNVGLAQVWRKVVRIDPGDVLVTVDRYGNERTFGYRPGRRWKVWQPGDPVTDGDNL